MERNKETAEVHPGRTKKDPDWVRNFLVDGSIKLKISASRKDWKLLFERYFSGQAIDRAKEAFAQDFYESFMLPWYYRVELRKMRIPFSQPWLNTHLGRIKAQAAYLYLFFSYVFKKYGNKPPNFVARIGDAERLIKQSGRGDKKRDKRDPAAHAALLMQHVWWGALKEQRRIKQPFFSDDPEYGDDLTNFYITYVLPGKELIREPSHLTDVCFSLVKRQYRFPLPQSYPARLLFHINKAGMSPEPHSETFESPDDPEFKAVRDLVEEFLLDHYKGDWP